MSPGSITPATRCNPPPTWFHPRSGAPIHPRPSSSPARTPSPIPSPARSSFTGWSTEQNNQAMKPHMKTHKKHLFLLLALVVVLNLLPAGHATAQAFTVLHSFTATSTNSSGIYTNSEGAGPNGGLIRNSSGNTLYGTAEGGGGSGNGTVF